MADRSLFVRKLTRRLPHSFKSVLLQVTVVRESILCGEKLDKQGRTQRGALARSMTHMKILAGQAVLFSDRSGIHTVARTAHGGRRPDYLRPIILVIAKDVTMSQHDNGLDTLPHVPRPAVWRFGKIGPPIQNATSKRRFVTQYGSHPLDIFTPAVHCGSVPAARWIYTNNEAKPFVFVFTDGASPGNGQPGASAGCGIVYNPLHPGISFPLEHSRYEPTSNRAELRAVIGALTMRVWFGEGFFGLVIGTDSEYVIKGATEWCQKWKANGWKTSTGTSVKNQDLWKILLEKIEEFEGDGFSVQFFQLKREWNVAADSCAKKGADEKDIPDSYCETLMIGS